MAQKIREMVKKYLFYLSCLLVLLFVTLNAEEVTADIEHMENPDTFMAKTTTIKGDDANPLEIDNFYLFSSRDHKMVSLNAYENKVVLLEFWTTWSRHCLQEIQPLNDLYNKYQKKGLEVIAIAVEDHDVVKEFLNNNTNIKYNVLFGSESMARDYNLAGLPAIYILDKKLHICKKFSGYIDKRTLEREIRKLL